MGIKELAEGILMSTTHSDEWVEVEIPKNALYFEGILKGSVTIFDKTLDLILNLDNNKYYFVRNGKKNGKRIVGEYGGIYDPFRE